jgi:ornithine cyclodeaminase
VAVPFVDAAELERRLPMAAAIDALEDAFRDADPSQAPLRSHVETAAGTLLLMPATGGAGVGVKLVTLTQANPGRGLPLIHALYVLFDPDTQAPAMLVDGAALTALRTGAVSGVATRYLARPDAHRLVVFGAGVQARSHLAAMRAVRSIDDVVVVGRTHGRAQVLVDEAVAAGLSARVGTANDVGDADIVCTCTTATEPLFDGEALPDAAHVNAVGAYRPDTREVDSATVRRSHVVVETREAAMEEAGDLLIPISEGTMGPDHIRADLREVVQGEWVRPAEGVSLFESVGLAFEDLAVAGALARADGGEAGRRRSV